MILSLQYNPCETRMTHENKRENFINIYLKTFIKIPSAENIALSSVNQSLHIISGFKTTLKNLAKTIYANCKIIYARVFVPLLKSCVSFLLAKIIYAKRNAPYTCVRSAQPFARTINAESKTIFVRVHISSLLAHALNEQSKIIYARVFAASLKRNGSSLFAKTILAKA